MADLKSFINTSSDRIKSAMGVPVDRIKTIQGSKLNLFDALAPSGLTLTVLSDTSIKIDFTVNSINAEGHSIERSTNGTDYSEISTVTGSTSTYTNTGLTANTLYYYRIRSYKNIVYSVYCTAKSTTTYLAETQTYITAVEADGGVVFEPNHVNSDLLIIKTADELTSLQVGFSAVGGVKTSVSNGRLVVDKLYDLSSNSRHATQTTAANKPGLYGDFSLLKNNFIDFIGDQGVGSKKLTHTSILNGDFTAFYILREVGTGLNHIHAGNIGGGTGSSFLSQISSLSEGPSMYKQSPAVLNRGSNEYPTSKTVRLLTYQPDHIYLNGTEVTYKGTYTSTMVGKDVNTIGNRADGGGTGLLYIECIYVFNKILSDENRQAIETHLMSTYLNSDYTTSSINELQNYSQLTYHILHQVANKIFAYDFSTSKLKYSLDNGSNWSEYSLTAGTNVKCGHIFSNGNLFFCTTAKVYKSTDNLTSVVEITPKDENGNNYTVSELNTFLSLGNIYSQIFGDDEIILIGSYSTAKAVFQSKNGDDCKIVYRFGAGYTYNANHIHACIYSANANEWYLTTGDASGIHWIKGIYNTSDDTWAWTYLQVGADTNQLKAVSLQPLGNNVFWSADITSGVNNGGIWRCSYSDVGTPANHVREIGLTAEMFSIIVENDRIIFVRFDGNNTGITKNWEILNYNRTTNIITRYYLSGLTPTVPANSLFPKLLSVGTNNYLLDFMNTSTGWVYNSVRFTL